MKHKNIMTFILLIIIFSFLYVFKKSNPDKSLMIIEYLENAERMQEAGNLSNAAEIYLYILQIDSTSIEAINNLANIYSKKLDYDKAIPLYKKAIKLNPSFALSYYNLGTAFYALGDSLKARKAFFKFLRKETENSNYNNLFLAVKKRTILATLTQWKNAWEGAASLNNTEEYKKLYSRQFKTEMPKRRGKYWNYETWMEDQAQKALEKTWIKIQIQQIRFDFSASDPVVRFCQIYESSDHNDIGKKELQLKIEGHNWRIVRENWRFAKCV